MPDGHGYCAFAEDCNDEDAEDEWEREHCRGCVHNFDRTCDDDPEDIEDEHGNPAIQVIYESCCPYGRGETAISDLEFPCAAGYSGPETDSSQYDGPMPPMAYAVNLNPATGRTRDSFAWMQGCHPPDASGNQLTGIYRTINAFDNHVICWGTENTTPRFLPEVVATYCDAPANADLLPPSEFNDNHIIVRRKTPSTKPPGVAIGPGYDAALLVSITHHRSAYLLLRGSGMQAVDGVISAGLRHTTVRHDDGTDLQGFMTDPDSDGRYWFFIMNPDGNPDTSRALLIAQLTTCTSTPPSSSAPAALAAN